jgi:hypothetical protein
MTNKNFEELVATIQPIQIDDQGMIRGGISSIERAVVMSADINYFQCGCNNYCLKQP